MKLIENHNQVVFAKRYLWQVIAIHLVTLGVAPFLFTWQAMLFAWVSLSLFAYSMGIFHHMYLTHDSFKTHKWIEYLGSLFGTLTWRGPFAGPVQYVAMHRVHHRYSDEEADPHTPTKGIFYALMGWFWNLPYGFSRYELYERHATDIAADPFHRFLDQHVDGLQLLWAIVCFGFGGSIGEAHGFDLLNGLRFVVYGVFVKSFLMIYLANLVDVINHTVGYRAYETHDHSTNSLLMFVVHLGGAISWHNNHHAHPSYFTVRKNWWEIDLHYAFLRTLGLFGLVWDIKVMDEYRREHTGAISSPA
ncbi:MAG: fatty acid desaturase [Bdellovibrionaceae bacterium]|nr:fatty acid desaturase [Bdellovibrionales bacterium]MCB9253792.1 fatty acid desaturase [Pseudobdellovibrionaceae bacterium]